MDTYKTDDSNFAESVNNIYDDASQIGMKAILFNKDDLPLCMEKVQIKGDSPHPVYSWLLNKNENGVGDHNVRWNFHKFLIDENGSLVGSLKSGVEPTDNQIISFASEK